MIYHQKNRKLFIGVIAIILIGYIIIAKPYQNLFSKTGLFFGKVAWSSVYPVSSFLDFVQTKKTLIEDKEKIERDLDKALFSLSRLRVLEDENKRLKELLNIKSGHDGMFVVAPVISGVIQQGRDIVIVSLSKDHKVSLNDDVFAAPGVAVGKVSEVFDDYARIRLYSTPGESNDFLISRSGIVVNIKGIGGGGFSTDLPKDTDIELDDSVVFQGTTDMVAFVNHVDDSFDQTLKRVFFSSPVNVYSLRELYIKQ